MYGIIYKIINDINNKIYIGQTTCSLNHRWAEHKREAKILIHNNKLYNAMHNLGIEHFTINLIEEYQNITQEKLDLREQYWIKYYDSFNNGYNSTKGGKLGYRNTDIVLCYTLSGILYKEYDTIGEAATDLNIHYDAIVTCLNNLTQESCGGFQFKYKNSDKEIKDYSQQSNFNAKKYYFIQYDLKGNYINHYLSVKEASLNTHCQESGIVRCINNKIRYCGDYVWKRGFFGEDFPLKINGITANTNKGKSRRVIYIDENNIETIYNSLSEAARITGYSRNKIAHNCNIYPNTTLLTGRFKYESE